MKKILVLVGPSGSGKDTLGTYLKENSVPELISHTTRKKRKGEIEGVSYNFVTKEDFDKIEKIEYSEYAGNYYCLSKNEVENKLHCTDMVFAITDINGMEQIKEQYPEETISIFISVTREEMEERMRERGDSEENIQKRIQNSIDNKELENGKYCDYIIRNDVLEEAKEKIDRILYAEMNVMH
jgi:guanylate kinase